jgi:DNA-binding NarL/FixJ family response regulator
MNRILIIEDEEILRNNLREILKLEGFEVFVSSNGQEGLELFQTLNPDLVLCDIKMPRMDGYEILKNLRSLPGGLTTAFIFLSAKVEHEDIRTGMNKGADDYLLKPVSRKDLLASIRNRLSKRDVLMEYIQRRINDTVSGHLEFGADELDSILSLLTKTERKVLFLVAMEKTTSEIADDLFISPKTVENHRHSISKKLNLKGGHSVLSFALKIKSLLLKRLGQQSEL